MNNVELSPLIQRKPRFKDDKLANKRYWNKVRTTGNVISGISGIVIMIRVLIDGKLSFWGTFLKLFSLGLTGAIILFDPHIPKNARRNYSTPKLAGFITTLITLIGIIIADPDNFYKEL